MKNIVFFLGLFISIVVPSCAQHLEEHHIPYPHQDTGIYNYYYQSKDNNVRLNLQFRDSISVQEMADSFYCHIESPHRMSPYAGKDSAHYLFDSAILSVSPLETYPEEVKEVRGLRGYWELFRGISLIGLYERNGTSRKETLDSLPPEYRKLEGHWNGNVFAWLAPAYYMGFVLSPHPMIQSFRNGEKVLLEVYQGPTDYFACSFLGSLHFDGNWQKSIAGSAYMLGHTMNGTPFLPWGYLPSPDTSVTFSILLYNTGRGYYDACLLLPREPDRNTQEIFKALQSGIRRLQWQIFRPYYTTDFRLMTGRYYRVTFDRRGWWFEDYLSFYEKEFVKGK